MIIHAGSAAFAITLNRNSPIPLYHQLFEQFTAAIDRGELKPGHTLEREDLLAERLEVARPTLRRALSGLAAQGLISRTRGQGTVVTLPPGSVSPRAEEDVTGVPSGDGVERSRVLRLDPDHIDPLVAVELGLEEHDRIVYLEHLRVASGRGISLRREWVPATLVNPVLHDLTVVPIGRILGELGHAAVTDRRTFERRPPDSTEMAVLDLTLADRVFTVCAVAFDRLGTPVGRTAVTYVREDDQYLSLRPAG